LILDFARTGIDDAKRSRFPGRWARDRESGFSSMG
jgi:hypothetical protein